VVESIGRTAAGKADYMWARRHVTSHPPSAGPPPAAGHLANAAPPGGVRLPAGGAQPAT